MERLNQLVDCFARLPGIGRKSASRIVYWILESRGDFVETFAQNLSSIKDQILRCVECGNYSEDKLCDVCSSPLRDKTLMCIVEHPRDVETIETTGEFQGLYHVLHGVLSPIDGVGPSELGLDKMRTRANREGVSEVIVATNPTLEGDSTALYIMRVLSEDGVKVSRIATGLPVGGDMEYADRLSITRALKARQELG